MNIKALVELRPLWRPIYLPSLVYAAAASVLGPIQVLLALQLGISAEGVIALATWIGAFSIVSSLASGYIVNWLGESRAVAWISSIGVVLLVVAAVAATWWLGVAFAILVVALTFMDLVDAVWSIARQGMVAELAPAHRRGLAMNLYGACQRLGRIAGPLLAAGILVFAQPQAALPIAAVVLLTAMGILLMFAPRRDVDIETPVTEEAPKRVLPGLLLMGVGVLVLAGLRTAKDSLLPLWAADVLAMEASTVALVVAATSAMELVLFLPAGFALDRFGRAPVVVASLILIGVGFLVIPVQTTVGMLVLGTVLIGLGNGVSAGLIKTLGVDLAPKMGRATFLGYWQSIASVGSFATPAMTVAVTAAAGLGASLTVMGGVGIIAAVWMGFWTPKLVPNVGAK